MKTTKLPLLLLVLCLIVGTAVVYGACYYAITSDRCAPSIAAYCTNTPPCYLEHSVDPTMFASYCDARDFGPPGTGANNCTNKTVVTQMQCKTNTCYPAGGGPDPTNTAPYCWNDGVWTPKTGPNCQQAVLFGGECPGG